MDSSDSDMDDLEIPSDNRRYMHRHMQSIQNEPEPHHNSISLWNKEKNGVTTLYKCNASDAKALYIFDIARKLQMNDQFDIGGAYTDCDTGIWFYFTTLSGPGWTYLMNIFLYQRKPGTFSLGISDSNTLSTINYNNEKVKTLSHELHWQIFSSTQPDEACYVKTFCFTETERELLEKKVLIIPISINMSTTSMLNKEIVQKIKADQEFGGKLLKDQEPDFILKSGEGKDFKVHKIVLAAHSPVLRDLIRTKDTLSLNITNDEIELLLEYLYTGLIKNISNLEVLLVMADKFQIDNLKLLVQQAMKTTVNSENALAIAIAAEKYHCNEVQEVVFKYIAHHPEVLDTDAFSQIDNANMVKKLLRYIHVKQSF